MRVMIADDEPVARQVLREMLEEIPGVIVAGEACNGAEALEQARRLDPDILLLDLQMPGMDGFQVAQMLPGKRRPSVIFVTAYHKHALEAFDAGALDYLLKPVRKERLEAALEKAKAHAPSKPAAAQDLRKIVGKRGSDLHLLDPAEVIAFQAEGDLVHIITAAGRYYASHSLKALEEKLPPHRFRRVHRSTIINTDQIRKISPLSSKRWMLRMSNGMEVVVSKRLAGVIRAETQW
ncbi:MAG TPA: LytTR family DNA-binding domain-containing protein [Bryobacteraceae bacterium]|nr:LytTR family DNA-binding domain-containing protein [Bryobacteraceae bacterium]